ncbi:MAG: protein BatD [Gammaproteobacteria bacterium]|nr:protein BatD [Gammaproteobacteria bacterium]MCP5137782.1 protein BatD [Gammaproteobacteria bacterium]
MVNRLNRKRRNIGTLGHVLLLLLLSPALTLGATIDAYVDRNPVAANESLQLTLEADSDPDGDPDFSPLKRDFDILSHATGSNVQIINGRVKRSVQWVLGLMPKRAGELEIPAIAFGRDRSPSIPLKVVQALATDPASADVFLEVEATPRNPYVQQQVIYTVRLYRAADTANATLSAPEFPAGEALIEKLDDDANSDVRRQGRRFQVTERRYAIYPQKSGALSIPPVRFSGQVLQTRRNVWDPFGGSYSARQVRSNSIDLEVRPIPPNFTGKHWLPAHEVRLAQAWADSPPTFQVGEPSTHTLAILADGLTAAQLPDVTLPLPNGAKGYPDQPELKDDKTRDGIAGLRQQKLAVIPQTQGEIQFPEITLDWWNTETDRQETARLPAQRFAVAAGIAATPAPPVQAAPPPMPVAPASRPAPIPEPTSPTASNLPGDAADPFDSVLHWPGWPWLSVALFLIWLVTLLFWWRSAMHRQPVAVEQTRTPKPNLNALRRACDADDAQGTKDALLTWTAAHWPDPTPTNLDGIRRQLAKGSALAVAIADLNHALYSPQRPAWSGTALKSALGELDQVASVASRPNRNAQDELEPLYRN